MQKSTIDRQHSDDALLTRRETLCLGAAGLTGLALTSTRTAFAEEPARSQDSGKRRDGYIDSHVHVWTPDTQKYRLAAGYTRADMQPPSFTPEELLEHATPSGVDRIVLVQMSFYGFNNSYMLDSMQRFPGVFSGIAVIDENDRPRETMRKLKTAGVRGFRIHPGKRKVDEWIGSAGMRQMWQTGADERLAMCALINPEAITSIDTMCAKHPETPVVIDHFARIGIDGLIRKSDLDNLCRLARHKPVRLKVSAFYALGKKQSPYTDLAGMIERVLEAFRPERLMWGSDCPYQVQEEHNYRDSIELIRSRLDSLSSTERDWLLRKTAEQTFFSA